MESWKEIELSSISELITKGTTPTSVGGGFSDSGINFIKSESLNYEGILEDEKFVFIDELSNKKLKRSVLKENDILFSIAGIYLGKIGIVRKQHLPANTNQACAIIRLRHDIVDYRFVKQYFSEKSFVFYINSLSGQAAQPNINLTDIGKLKLILPPLPTQKRIASILSAYDDLIEVNNQRIKLLEQTARELYKEWFVRMRFPGYKKVKFKKGLPEGWEVKKIGEICKVARGSSPRPIIDQRYFENGKIPWVKIADATASGKFLFETKEYVNEFGASFSRKLKEGSLIIATSGTLGFCIFLAIEACIHDGWLYTTDYKDSVTSEFLFFVINDRTEYFNNLSYGAAIQNINTDILRNTPFLKPTTELLERFQKIIVPINEQQKNLQQQNTQLRQIRDRLLPRLVSGKLRAK